MPPRFGKLNEINKFDASFFNILSNTADVMDPMARILLEKTYEAIIDAGMIFRGQKFLRNFFFTK